MPGSNLPVWRLPLRVWQSEAFAVWQRTRPRDSLFVATPGAGKTRFATRLAHALHAERGVARTIVVVPREHLKSQFARAMAGAGLQLDHRFRNVDLTLAADLDGAVVTYQQVAAAPRRLAALARIPALIVLDEIDHAGEQATWGEALREAFGGPGIASRYRERRSVPTAVRFRSCRTTAASGSRISRTITRARSATVSVARSFSRSTAEKPSG